MNNLESYWPDTKPDVPTSDHGWVGKDDKRMLHKLVKPDMKNILELGAWLGKSTRIILDRAPKALVVTIDTWEGSPEHQRGPWKKMLPTLHDTFLANCWEYRDRLLPLQSDTAVGMQLVSRWSNFVPEIIFIDAAHDYKSVLRDITTAMTCWPSVTICGDDWGHGGVAKAVKDIASSFGKTISRDNSAWWLK